MNLRHLLYYFFILLFSCVEPTLVPDKDCTGTIGGDAVVDNCGVCEGDNSTCGIFDIDGNHYLTVQIGEQEWNGSRLKKLFLQNLELTNLPESICNLTFDWGGENESGVDYFNISNNNLCSSIPTCIEDYIGEQDCDD